MAIRCALLLAVAAIGCGDDPARVQLAPIDHACGKPAGARNIRLIAYGTSGEDRQSVAPGETVSIADFPSDTEQLGIEIEVGGGTVGVTGKTAPFDFLALDDGARLPVFLAPPNGFCPTVEPMQVARIAPLLARAGEGVLVVGGRDGNGAWLKSAEYYDPQTSTFATVELPDLFLDPENDSGFAGMALATLPDGRVVMSGGAFQQMAIFDPATRRIVSSGGIEARAFHATVALGDDEILLAGGCQSLAAGACTGLPRRSTKTYALDDTLNPEVGPNLRVGRLGATLFDIGLQRDGQRGFVMAGGVAPMPEDAARADRVLIGPAADGVAITDVHAQAAALDGGGVLTAFEVDGTLPASGLASVIAPGVDAARPITKAPDLDGVRMVLLEDGRVLGVGGDTDVLLFDPTTERWQSLAPAGTLPDRMTAPSLARLADGSVLVTGSADAGGEARTAAWIFRPSLVGPAMGTITVQPLFDATGVLTPEDPATVTRTLDPERPTWTLTAGIAMARALVGGPRTRDGAIAASLRVRSGGVALIAQQLAPGSALVGELFPGRPARIVRLAGSTEDVQCTGRVVPQLPPLEAGAEVVNAQARFEVDGGTARLSLDGSVLASCEVSANERGAWGVAAMEGSSVSVDLLTVDR